MATLPFQTMRCHMTWKQCIEKIAHINFDRCAQELIQLLDNVKADKSNVVTFHVHHNNQHTKSTEPNHHNVEKMIHRFIYHIFQRNLITSLTKYIILHSTLKTFEALLSENRNCLFRLIHKRLQEMLFETMLLAFNCSNYDNYLLINYLI